MKFHFEIINDLNSGSRDVVHSFCLFEAPDSIENKWKVFGIYREDIKKIQSPGFELDCQKKVEVLFGG